jgi:hypothetical protein
MGKTLMGHALKYSTVAKALRLPQIAGEGARCGRYAALTARQAP